MILWDRYSPSTRMCVIGTQSRDIYLLFIDYLRALRAILRNAYVIISRDDDQIHGNNCTSE